jgi:hypothetical protein
MSPVDMDNKRSGVGTDVEKIVPTQKNGEMIPRLFYVWDYDIDDDRFRSILEGREKLGRLDRDWAAVRLLEYAPYTDIVRLIGYRALVKEWSKWRRRVRSQSRRRGFDFLVSWLPQHHPELLRAQ